MARRRRKGMERQIALQRIRRLIELAHDVNPDNEPLRDRYVILARRIGMRYQVGLPSDVRRRVCRECNALLVPGRSSRVRLTTGRLSVTCLRCNRIKRYPYSAPLPEASA